MKLRWKKWMALGMAGMLAFSAVGCSKAQEKIEQENTGHDNGTESVSKEIYLTDQAGRQVLLEGPAKTVVSGYYISTYAMLALGLADRVAGLEKKADTRPIYRMAAPELLEKTAVGTMKEMDVEAVAALQPDLVILPKKLMAYADTYAELGIQTIVVNPESGEQLLEMLALIGKACGAEEKAQQLAAYYKDKQEQIRRLTEGADKPLVYIAGNSSYRNTAPAAMYQSDMIAAAGGENAAVRQGIEGDYWVEVSYETILAMNPEIIIIPCGAAYTADDVMNDAELASVDAVKNQKIYMMPQEIEEWDSPIPAGILGILWTASVLHPDLYGQEQLIKDVTEFYRTFYGFEIDSALITR